MGGDQLVCPEGCSRSGWGFRWGVGLPESRTCGCLLVGHAPRQPKQRPWYLEFIYLLQLKLFSLERSQTLFHGCSHFCLDFFTFYSFEWKRWLARTSGKLGFLCCQGQP